MTFAFQNERYTARLAATAQDIETCQRLRHLCFFGAPGVDAEPIDERCQHIIVERAGDAVATCRVFVVTHDYSLSYAAQRYDLNSISDLLPALEIGRLCISPDVFDHDPIRLLWGGISRIVTETAAKLLFGCVSFQGTDPTPHHAAFSKLYRFHQPIDGKNVAPKSKETIALSAAVPSVSATATMPPLLRSYLSMGGWVSDHAVVDKAMDTLHVFCAVEIDKIAPERARTLRALAT